MVLVSLVRALPARYKWGLGLAAVAILLGGIGWHGSGVEDITGSDVAYRAFAVLGFSDLYKDLPKTGWARLPLEVARFLGPLALLVLAGSVLFDLAHKSDIRGKASKSAGMNAIIVGSGPIAHAAAGIELPARFKRIVHLGAGVLSHSGRVFRLPWEAPNLKAEEVSRFVRCAEHVIVAEADDAETLLLALSAQKAEPGALVTAVVKDSRLADDFADMLAGDNKPAHALRVLSAASLAARDLHLNYPPFLAASELGQQRIHAVIVGFGDTGEAIARDIATNCLVLGLKSPQITVIDPEIAAREAALRLRVPELDQTVRFVGMKGAFGGRVAPPLVQPNDMDSITHLYLCLGSDLDTLAAAGAVRQWLRSLGQPQVPLFLRLRDGCLLPEGMGAVAFGDTSAIVELSRWLDDGADEAAMTLHRGYRTNLGVLRRDENQASTTRGWKSLTPDVQRSNQAAVAHMPAKLASAGVDKIHWLGRSDIPKLSHASGLLSHLRDFSRLEHDRWNAERRWAGWAFSGRTRAEGGEKDTNRRLHPDLVPFDRLTTESQRYDAASIELLERLLTGGDPVGRNEPENASSSSTML